MGEDAGRDRLEELQRRPRDHQHVEDEARRRGALQAADDQRPGVEEGLFAEHDHAARPRRSRRRGRSENSSSLAPASRPAASAACRRVLRLSCAPPGEGEGDDQQAERRGGDDADRDRRLAAEDADRDQHREDRAEAGFGEDQRDEQAEALAGRRGSRGRSSWPRRRGPRRRRPSRGFRCPPAGRSGSARAGPGRATAKKSERPSWIVEATRIGWPIGSPFDQPLGDVAGEQLFDRPVEGRDRDEDRRPEHRDLPVVGLGEDVRGDQEVGVGDHAR